MPNKTETVAFRASSELHKKIQKAAENSDYINPSDWLRTAAREKLKKVEEEP
jgi:hypothetical protein